MKTDLTMTEFLVAQLEQPVLTTQIDEVTGAKVKRTAKDPNDGHELTAKEAIAMKLLQNALNGDTEAIKIIIELKKTPYPPFRGNK